MTDSDDDQTDTRAEKRDEIHDRLSSRFEKPDTQEKPDDSDKPDDPDNLEKTDNPDMPAKTDTPEDLEQPDSPEKPEATDTPEKLDPKETWTGRNIYVPDGEAGPDLLASFDGEYRRFQYECDWEIRKQTHYYPVLIVKGIERLEEMDGEEFTNCVDDLGLR